MSDSKAELKELLVEGLQKLHVHLSSILISQFMIYLDILTEWNKKINLTAIDEPRDIIIKHFFDSVSCKEAIDTTKEYSLVDIGTGAGFPGIPLKLCFPNLKMTVVDSVGKKTDFIKILCKNLRIDDIAILTDRAEKLGVDVKYRGKYHYVLTRALCPMPEVIELSLPFLSVGGKLIAQKSVKANEEIENSKKALEMIGGKISRVIPVNIPFLDAKRFLVVIEKIKPTPSLYPRNHGVIKKHPLV